MTSHGASESTLHGLGPAELGGAAHELGALAPSGPAEVRASQRLARIVETWPFDDPLSIRRAARQLGISARTLQRRLREEGLTHRAVVDGVREALALRLLANGDHRVSDIAARLGYSDTATFHRAFRRWTGVTPGAYRQLVKQRDGSLPGHAAARGMVKASPRPRKHPRMNVCP